VIEDFYVNITALQGGLPVALLKREETSVQEHHPKDIHTILGVESVFEGKLVFEGTVRLDGAFKGHIQTKDTLIIGEKAKIEANIEVGSLIVNGEVHGDIVASKSVELNAPAKVQGSISTPQLEIDKGVMFDGTSKMLPANTRSVASNRDNIKVLVS
jgi:cytoskeletal protein CcmA (bactofilin family)